MGRSANRRWVSGVLPWAALVTAALFVPGALGGAFGTAAVGPTTVTFRAWVNLSSHSPSNSTPSARQAYGMAYDPNLPGVVLFGGNDPYGGALGDTWEFSYPHWKLLNYSATSNGTGSGNAPTARWSEGMIYDPMLSGILLFGGQDGYLTGCGSFCALNDTWEFNATGWHDLNLSYAPPLGGGSQLVWDTHDGYALLLFHPYGMPHYLVEWRFVGGAWVNATATIVHAPPALGFFFSDNAAGGYVLLFGGNSGCTGVGLTWMFRGGAFHNLTAKQTAVPAALMGSHAMTYDPRVRGVVLTGGYNAACRVQDQTWLFHAGLWTNVSNVTGTSIPGRWDARMVWDAQVGHHGGDVTFSGNEASVGGANNFGSDTWSLSP